MTVEVPLTTESITKPTNVAVVVEEATDDEPSLITQLESSSETNADQEVMSESEGQQQGKRKGLFNNPFVKDTAKKNVVSADEAGENKITKGIGNFLSKVKQTISSTNISELAPPTTTTVEVEPADDIDEEQAAITEDVPEIQQDDTPTTTEAQSQNNKYKRQSFLAKLFGRIAAGTSKEQQKEQVPTTSTPSLSSDKSPLISRRVTGFFVKNKLVPKKQKTTSSDKVETTEEEGKIVTTTSAHDDITKEAKVEEKDSEKTCAEKVIDTKTAIPTAITTH